MAKYFTVFRSRHRHCPFLQLFIINLLYAVLSVVDLLGLQIWKILVLFISVDNVTVIRGEVIEVLHNLFLLDTPACEWLVNNVLHIAIFALLCPIFTP